MDPGDSREPDRRSDSVAVGGLTGAIDFGAIVEALYNIGLTSDTNVGEAVRNRVRTFQFGFSLPFS